MRKMKQALAAGLAAAAMMAASSAGAVTIVNGGFETASVNPGGGFSTLFTGSTAIDGWTVGGHSIDYIGGYWQPAEGQRSLDLAGNAPGGVSQTLNGLTIGTTYTVSFFLAGNPDAGAPLKVLIASDGGFVPDIFTFDTTASTHANMGWVQRSFDFTASNTTATLTFAAQSSSGAYGPALDNVSITAVPEPATWGLMIMGFGGAGAMIRSRRRQAALA